MNTNVEFDQKAPADQVVLAIQNRRKRDALHSVHPSVAYMEERYPTRLCQQLNSHWPDNYWFGWLLNPLAFDEMNKRITPGFSEPANGDCVGDYILDILVDPALKFYWDKYQLTERTSTKRWYAFRFGDLDLGWIGCPRVHELYYNFDNLGCALYDPSEKGRCILDVPIRYERLVTHNTFARKFLVMECELMDGEWVAKRLTVGDTSENEPDTVPWTSEVCHARSVSLTLARELGYERAQISKYGCWKSNTRKDPS